MKDYEALFILKPETEEKTAKLIHTIQESIKTNKGKINKEENWGKKTISYPIKKQKEGVYYKINFSVDPSAIDKMDKGYKLNSSILRTLIIKR